MLSDFRAIFIYRPITLVFNFTAQAIRLGRNRSMPSPASPQRGRHDVRSSMMWFQRAREIQGKENS
jgi:hypothetical protein